MNRILLATLLVVLVQACQSGPTGKQAFRIEGKLKDTSFEMLYLEEVPLETNRPAIVDSARPDKKGNFTLNAPTAEDRIYYVRAAQQPYPLFAVVNDTKLIEVDFQFDRIDGQLSPVYTAKGSPASEQVHDFSIQLNEAMRKILKERMGLDSILKKTGSDSLLRSVQDRILVQAKSIRTLTDSVLNNKATTPSTYVLILGFYQSAASNPGFGLQGFTLEEVAGRINKLAEQNPKHAGLAAFRKQIEAEIQKSKGLIGQTAPDFTLPDVTGKPIALSSFRGKWVLVDFWASWCKPCRMENPNVVAAYRQFKDKNFTILGVSLDRPDGREDWIQAIQQDKLDWAQVSELKFWESIVVPMYNIRGIPYNVLLDPQGKVVAENLRGSELAKKLNEVLK